jgi:hypothetical protein
MWIPIVLVLGPLLLRGARQGSMRGLAVLVLGLTLLGGCAGEKSSSSSSPTGPTAPEVAKADGSVTAEAAIRDRFLFDHNAAFNGGRTFRWVPPIPIFIGTDDPAVDGFLLEQFMAWEVALAGAGGSPFYAPQPMSPQLPGRGIFLVRQDLGDAPGSVTLGCGDPFGTPPQTICPVTNRLFRRAPLAAVRRLEIPEILTSGEIQRCVMVLDPVLETASTSVVRATIRHEVGHCLGFIGHVSNRRSLMHASSCCPLAITADITRMMRRLYGAPPGTEVRR